MVFQDIYTINTDHVYSQANSPPSLSLSLSLVPLRLCSKAQTINGFKSAVGNTPQGVRQTGPRVTARGAMSLKLN